MGKDRYIQVGCPVCHGTGVGFCIETVNGQSLAVERCSQCSMVFVNPRLANICDAGYCERVSEYEEKHLGEYKTRVFAEILDHMEAHRAGIHPKLLDVGSGLSYWLC